MGKKRILIADDDRQVRKALRARLAAWGYAVVESADGLGVIAQAIRERVDALVLDHEMPLGDGQTVARFMRRETEAPIIFLTGHDEAQFRDTLRDLPDVYFLSKPLDPAQLHQVLQSCLHECSHVPVGG